jgi:Acetoacetate decarboxylase (ADC)
VTIESTTERPPRAATLPLVHTRLFPAIEGPEPAVREFQLGAITDFECGTIHTGRATLDIGATEYEEIEALTPSSVGGGYVFSMAFSVTGGRVEPA